MNVFQGQGLNYQNKSQTSVAIVWIWNTKTINNGNKYIPKQSEFAFESVHSCLKTNRFVSKIDTVEKFIVFVATCLELSTRTRPEHFHEVSFRSCQTFTDFSNWRGSRQTLRGRDSVVNSMRPSPLQQYLLQKNPNSFRSLQRDKALKQHKIRAL